MYFTQWWHKNKNIDWWVSITGIRLTDCHCSKMWAGQSDLEWVCIFAARSTARDVLLLFALPSGFCWIEPTLLVTQLCPVWSCSNVVKCGERLLTSTFFIVSHLWKGTRKIQSVARPTLHSKDSSSMTPKIVRCRCDLRLVCTYICTLDTHATHTHLDLDRHSQNTLKGQTQNEVRTH